MEVGSASVNDRASGSLSQGPPSDLSEINEKATQPHLKKFPDRDTVYLARHGVSQADGTINGMEKVDRIQPLQGCNILQGVPTLSW